MSTQKFKLSADERKVFGRKVKSLRHQGVLPANIFGKKITSQSIQVTEKDFVKVYNDAGETGLIDLSVAGNAGKPVLVSAVQYHPVTNAILHVDFHQVDLKEKVTATVPVELEGEAPAVKEKGAMLLNPLSEVSVEALPTDIPSSFTLDISGLVEFNDSLHVKDIKVDSDKVTIQNDPDELVVVVQEPKAEEEPVEAESPAEEGSAPDSAASDSTEQPSES